MSAGTLNTTWVDVTLVTTALTALAPVPNETVMSAICVGKPVPARVTVVPWTPDVGVKVPIVGTVGGGVGVFGEWSHELVAGGIFQNFAANVRRGEHAAYSGPSLIVPEG